MDLWIARDKGGLLCLFSERPIRESNGEYYSTNKDYYLPINKDMFPEVTFENSPQKVELKLIEEIVGVKESPSKTFPRVNEFEAGASYRR